MASPVAIGGAETTLLSALEASREVAVSEPSASVQVAWPYGTFGAPGKVVETKDAVDLDTTFIRFERRAPDGGSTRFKDDEVLVSERRRRPAGF